MSFITYIPTDSLKPYINSLAISVNEKAQSYKVLPGTSIVMGFQFSGKLFYTNGTTQQQLSSAGITGLLSNYRTFLNTANTGTVLVMFNETGAAAFLKEPLHEIFGRSLSLDDVMLRSQMDMISEQLNECTTDAERIKVVEEFLLSRLTHQVPDELVNLAVSLIKQAKGDVKIALLAQKLNISQGRFEKRFRKIVGASPKKFASIVRIKHITQLPKHSNFTDMAYDSGYFDQAHFIKDFKSFTGETPEQFFKGKL